MEAARRLEGFDALRAFAAVLVVALHAAIPYLVDPVPGLLWATTDLNADRAIDVAFRMGKGFVMPLFLFISGYFAAASLSRKSSIGFLKQRARRLLIPFLVAMVTVLPCDFYVWIFGMVVDRHIPAGKLLHPKFEANIAAESALHTRLWGLSHLWFLQYLLLYCFLLTLLCAAARWTATRISGGSRFRRRRVVRLVQVSLSASIVPVLVAVSAAILWRAPEVVVGFQHGFLPFPSKFAYLGLFFVAGVCLFHQAGRLELLVTIHRGCLCTAAAAAVIMLPLIRRHLAAELSGEARVLLAVSMAAFAWSCVGGLSGFFLTHCTRPRPAVRHLAEASFWIYLIHHPIVALLQIAAGGWNVSALWKFSAVVVAGLALTLVSYRYAMRSAWIGALMHGRRHAVSGAVAAADVPVPAPDIGELAKPLAAEAA